MKLELKIPPPIVALVCGLGMWMISRAFDSIQIDFEYRIPLAIAVLAIGLLIDVAALIKFKSAATTINPIAPEKSSALVVSGIYQYTRNPMYLGLLLLLTAWGVYLANPIAFIFLPVFVYYITVYQIIPEEAVMQSLFGDDYTLYRAKVRRWL